MRGQICLFSRPYNGRIEQLISGFGYISEFFFNSAASLAARFYNCPHELLHGDISDSTLLILDIEKVFNPGNEYEDN